MHRWDVRLQICQGSLPLKAEDKPMILIATWWARHLGASLQEGSNSAGLPWASAMGTPAQTQHFSCQFAWSLTPFCWLSNLLLSKECWFPWPPSSWLFGMQEWCQSRRARISTWWQALGTVSVLSSFTLHLTMSWSPTLYFEHFRKAGFASQHSCGDKLEGGEWAHSSFSFMEELHFQCSAVGKSSWPLIQRRGRAPMWYATKTGFLRAGLNASLSSSTLPQLEQSPWSPAASAHISHLAGLMTSSELASKDIFLRVSLRVVREPTYLGANSILKHWNLVSYGQATFWQNVALNPNLLTFKTLFFSLTLLLKGEKRWCQGARSNKFLQVWL